MWCVYGCMGVWVYGCRIMYEGVWVSTDAQCMCVCVYIYPCSLERRRQQLSLRLMCVCVCVCGGRGRENRTEVWSHYFTTHEASLLHYFTTLI